MNYKIEHIRSTGEAINALKALDDLSEVIKTFKSSVNNAGIMDEHARTCFEALSYFIYFQTKSIKELEVDNPYGVDLF